jgi:hypothetical protein
MAVTTQYGVEYTSIFQTEPPAPNETHEWHGRLRTAYCTHVQSGVGDATSIIYLFKLPPGSVRLMVPMCWAYVNWTTASATLDMGYGAYTNLAGTAVAADVDGIIDGISVESAGVIGFEELTASAGAACTAANGYTVLFD